MLFPEHVKTQTVAFISFLSLISQAPLPSTLTAPHRVIAHCEEEYSPNPRALGLEASKKGLHVDTCSLCLRRLPAEPSSLPPTVCVSNPAGPQGRKVTGANFIIKSCLDTTEKREGYMDPAVFPLPWPFGSNYNSLAIVQACLVPEEGGQNSSTSAALKT